MKNEYAFAGHGGQLQVQHSRERRAANAHPELKTKLHSMLGYTIHTIPRLRGVIATRALIGTQTTNLEVHAGLYQSRHPGGHTPENQKRGNQKPGLVPTAFDKEASAAAQFFP
eukprot:1160464-Pelagomonas_calceolata.AAC.11